VREPAEQVVKDLRQDQHYPDTMSKTFKYEDIEQIPAEAESTFNASKFHNKGGEIHEENVARTRIGRSDYDIRFICPAGKGDFRTDRCCQPRQYNDR
jgi:lipopolysaccharide biosynthesis protein